MLFLIIQTVIISLTGVMAPGPITAATVGSGVRSPHAGAHVALGHGIVEIPVIIMIYLGAGGFLSLDPVRGILFTLGGLFLLFMGAGMLAGMNKKDEVMRSGLRTPFLAGAVLSIGNVYFLLWWTTVGAALLARAVVYGIQGVVIFAVVHWLCDFLWCYFLSAAAFFGGKTIGAGFLKAVYLVSGVFLVFFGFFFLVDASRVFFG